LKLENKANQSERKKQMEEHIAEKKRLRAEEEARGEL
jgi:hypothetical protein